VSNSIFYSFFLHQPNNDLTHHGVILLALYLFFKKKSSQAEI